MDNFVLAHHYRALKLYAHGHFDFAELLAHLIPSGYYIDFIVQLTIAKKKVKVAICEITKKKVKLTIGLLSRRMVVLGDQVWVS